MIETLLADKALDPQALVIVKKSSANTVSVSGEVVAGARVPLSPGGDRLLQVIAAAGGLRAPAYEPVVRTGLKETIPIAAVGDTKASVYETFVRLSRNGVTAICVNLTVVPTMQQMEGVADADVFETYLRPPGTTAVPRKEA